jgi:hypothetical protein
LTSFSTRKVEMMAFAVCTRLVVGLAEPGKEGLLLGLLLGRIIAKLDLLEVLISDCLWSVESVGTNGGSA